MALDCVLCLALWPVLLLAQLGNLEDSSALLGALGLSACCLPPHAAFPLI